MIQSGFQPAGSFQGNLEKHLNYGFFNQNHPRKNYPSSKGTTWNLHHNIRSILFSLCTRCPDTDGHGQVVLRLRYYWSNSTKKLEVSRKSCLKARVSEFYEGPRMRRTGKTRVQMASPSAACTVNPPWWAIPYQNDRETTELQEVYKWNRTRSRIANAIELILKSFYLALGVLKECVIAILIGRWRDKWAFCRVAVKHDRVPGFLASAL